MDLYQTAVRISVRFSQKGQSVGRKKIEVKLLRLVDEFGVQPAEAERIVTNELAKEFNLPGFGTGPSGSGRAGAKEERSIYEIAPGESMTIEDKRGVKRWRIRVSSTIMRKKIH
jgi:replication factor A1